MFLFYIWSFFISLHEETWMTIDLSKKTSAYPYRYALTPSIFVAEVRKPPHISKANNISCHSQKKLHLTAPVSSLLHLCWGCFLSTFLVWHVSKRRPDPVHLCGLWAASSLFRVMKWVTVWRVNQFSVEAYIILRASVTWEHTKGEARFHCLLVFKQGFMSCHITVQMSLTDAHAKSLKEIYF